MSILPPSEIGQYCVAICGGSMSNITGLINIKESSGRLICLHQSFEHVERNTN